MVSMPADVELPPAAGRREEVWRLSVAGLAGACGCEDEEAKV